MPKLYSSRYVVAVLQRFGFVYVSQSGSHAKFRKVVGRKIYTVIVPAGKKEIPIGTFKSILRQSDLRKSDFENKRNKI